MGDACRGTLRQALAVSCYVTLDGLFYSLPSMAHSAPFPRFLPFFLALVTSIDVGTLLLRPIFQQILHGLNLTSGYEAT